MAIGAWRFWQSVLRRRGRQMRMRQAFRAWQPWRAWQPGAAWYQWQEEDASTRDRRAQAGRGGPVDYDEPSRRSARRAAEQTHARAAAETENDNGTRASDTKTPSSEQDDRTLLFAIFNAMRRHEDEFGADGRPLVKAVNERAEKRGVKDRTFSRSEIDDAYDAWQQQTQQSK